MTNCNMRFCMVCLVPNVTWCFRYITWFLPCIRTWYSTNPNKTTPWIFQSNWRSPWKIPSVNIGGSETAAWEFPCRSLDVWALGIQSPCPGPSVNMTLVFRDWYIEIALTKGQALPLLKAAYDLGINTWDTANVYSNGASEAIVGKALKKVRHSSWEGCHHDKMLLGCCRRTWYGCHTTISSGVEVANRSIRNSALASKRPIWGIQRLPKPIWFVSHSDLQSSWGLP
jgi:Predicted oxidoreductases (related to aryl-alcohol dehydrogenases)